LTDLLLRITDKEVQGLVAWILRHRGHGVLISKTQKMFSVQAILVQLRNNKVPIGNWIL
jgi:hypothetical protein